jgi:hypothetical protein
MMIGARILLGLLLTVLRGPVLAQCQERWISLRPPVTNPPWSQLSGRCVTSCGFDGPGGFPALIAIGGGVYGPIGQPGNGHLKVAESA